MNEKYIIENIEGNTLGFGYFLKKSYHRIFGFTNNFFEDKDDCKEVIQETFVKFWNPSYMANLSI